MGVEDPASFDILQKFEGELHPTYGKGIKFKRSSKEEIDSEVSRNDTGDINQFLDKTFGYYTIDNGHGFVLAHYNWHELADERLSKGFTDLENNLKKASEILNRRIARMLNICHGSNLAILVYHNPQEYKYMAVDDSCLDLDNLSEVKKAAGELFGSKAHVVTTNELLNSLSLREQVKLLRESRITSSDTSRD